MRGTSVYRQRKDKEEKPRARTVLLNAVVVTIIAIVAYFLAGFLMDQLELYDLLGLDSVEMRGAEASIPEWALQVVLGVILFFILQPLVVIALDLFGAGKKKDETAQPYQDQWRR